MKGKRNSKHKRPIVDNVRDILILRDVTRNFDLPWWSPLLPRKVTVAKTLLGGNLVISQVVDRSLEAYCFTEYTGIKQFQNFQNDGDLGSNPPF